MNIPIEFLVSAAIFIMGFLVTRAFKARDEAQENSRKTQEAKNAAYDQHLKDCGDRNEKVAGINATMTQQLCAIEENLARNTAETKWLGSCMEKVGAKLNTDLPDRPI
jgi:hypothetical protein